MKTALTRVINDYARRQIDEERKRKEKNLSGERCVRERRVNCRYFHQTRSAVQKDKQTK